ncbi:MAG: hypothetical protein RDU25_00625 [Patescibacteria group bacterium]|nr:hypothetical protein [Patescibacteria group bacterium]
MSERPKHDSGQVASLTEHRAAKSGEYKPSSFDRPFHKGQRISCDDRDMAYHVRIGTVAVVKEMQSGLGGRVRATVDYIQPGEPLWLDRFFSVTEDQGYEFVAETDVIIAEVPLASFGDVFETRDFLRAYGQMAARHILTLRRAYTDQMLSLQARQDEAADAEMSAQLDLAKARQIEEANRKLKARISSLEVDLRKSREREAAAIKPAQEATEYLRELEQRQREESTQVLRIVNDVLNFLGQESIEPEELMFILTTEQDHGMKTRTRPPATAVLDDAIELTDDELTPVTELTRQPAASRPRMETVSFEDEPPTAPSAGNTSSYRMIGSEIPQDAPVQVTTACELKLRVAHGPKEDTWADEPASSQRGAVMPTPGWNFEDDATLFETTRDIEIPPDIGGTHAQVEVPSAFPRVRPVEDRKLVDARQPPPIVMPIASQNEGGDRWSAVLDTWDGESERPTSSGQPPVDCPPPSGTDMIQAGITTSVWDVGEIQRLKEEADKNR